MKIKDPEVLKTLRDFCKVEARRMRAEEEAELARRASAKASTKRVQKADVRNVERKPARKAGK